MPDPSQVFARILETLGVANAPQIADKLGLEKQSVYDWKKKLPSLTNLIKIAESGNTSLDWLLYGRVIKDPSPLDSALDQRIREIVREELSAKDEDPENEKTEGLQIKKVVKKSKGGARNITVGSTDKKKTA